MEPVSSLRIDADVNNLIKIRTFLQESISNLGVDQEMIDDIILAVDEAATNIILHGYQGQPGLIEIEVRRTSDSTFVCLMDQAPSFNPTRVPPPDLTLPLKKRPKGNLGLHLMRNLVDEVIYKTPPGGGNQLKLVKIDPIP
jgi:serine/threonine-protein kinase RsbW